MYTLYKFHFLNGISEINQLFDDILIIWPAPVYIYIFLFFTIFNYNYNLQHNSITKFIHKEKIQRERERERETRWSMTTRNSLVTDIIQNIFFHDQEKKYIHTDLK